MALWVGGGLLFVPLGIRVLAELPGPAVAILAMVLVAFNSVGYLLLERASKADLRGIREILHPRPHVALDLSRTESLPVGARVELDEVALHLRAWRTASVLAGVLWSGVLLLGLSAWDGTNAWDDVAVAVFAFAGLATTLSFTIWRGDYWRQRRNAIRASAAGVRSPSPPLVSG